jgi:hypothetical protein
MIKKQEIINVLIDEGLSIIESDRTLDTVENFRLCVQDVEEKAVSERIDPIINLIKQFPYPFDIIYDINKPIWQDMKGNWHKGFWSHEAKRWFVKLKELVKDELQ